VGGEGLPRGGGLAVRPVGEHTMPAILLTLAERQELLHLRDHAPKPYQRERAAALLKVADGMSPWRVAREGLLRPRKPDTVYGWVHRFHRERLASLPIRPGRGRKPAFSP
jgi:hypothetical protein